MKAAMKITDKLIDWLVANGHCPRVTKDNKPDMRVYRTITATMLVKGTLSPEKYEELCREEDDNMSPDPEKMFARTSHRIRVKDPSEGYSTKRYVGKHVKTGRPVFNPLIGRDAEMPSDADYAKCGVLLKHLARRSGLFTGIAMPEHEKALLDEMARTDTWAGNIGGEYHDAIPGGTHVKALIDDVTSGGMEISPLFFDNQVVSFPLLTGELLPRVDLRPVEKGRRIQGGSISTPTVSWGQGDATEADLFDTANMVASVDSTVFGCAVAVEVGRDYLSDAGVDVGSILTRLIGERMQAELDKMIASGNGTTQPEGILVGSGLTEMNTDNGAGGGPTLNDYTALMFSIGKQYRNRGFDPIFLSNDTTYQRSRTIRVDPHTIATTVNQTPVLADVNSFSNYATLGWPHAVQNDVPNGTAVFGAMKKYRLYRRLGMEIQWVQGGLELARRNTVLLVVRARYAGRVVDANAFAKWTDGQS